MATCNTQTHKYTGQIQSVEIVIIAISVPCGCGRGVNQGDLTGKESAIMSMAMMESARLVVWNHV
eukprot:COSAG05_NODE_214_length_13907_cov_28.992178_18_plen_65_part_00